MDVLRFTTLDALIISACSAAIVVCFQYALRGQKEVLAVLSVIVGGSATGLLIWTLLSNPIAGGG